MFLVIKDYDLVHAEDGEGSRNDTDQECFLLDGVCTTPFFWLAYIRLVGKYSIKRTHTSRQYSLEWPRSRYAIGRPRD